MNTKTLAKNYSSLTPSERLPLYMQAVVRGDEQEKKRIADACKLVSIQVCDTFTRSSALREVSDLFFMETLNMIMTYFLTWHEPPAKKSEDQFEQLRCTMFYGYLVRTYIAGWRDFA